VDGRKASPKEERNILEMANENIAENGKK